MVTSYLELDKRSFPTQGDLVGIWVKSVRLHQHGRDPTLNLVIVTNCAQDCSNQKLEGSSLIIRALARETSSTSTTGSENKDTRFQVHGNRSGSFTGFVSIDYNRPLRQQDKAIVISSNHHEVADAAAVKMKMASSYHQKFQHGAFLVTGPEDTGETWRSLRITRHWVPGPNWRARPRRCSTKHAANTTHQTADDRGTVVTQFGLIGSRENICARGREPTNNARLPRKETGHRRIADAVKLVHHGVHPARSGRGRSCD